MGHYEERLEQDLGRIQENIRDIAGMVETALRDSVKGLLEGDAHIANMTVLRDNRINRVSRRIDRQCHAFIAKHLPGAGHLRWISSVIRLNVALERVGDYAVTISRESLQLSAPPGGELPRDLARLADESGKTLTQSVEAFLEGSADKAAATIPISERVEDSMDDIYARLIDSAEGRSAREIVAVFVVFSLLKRVSDQAKNICEQTIFAVAGERKKTRPFHVLFVATGNNERGLIAQGIAAKNFAHAGEYRGAAPEPESTPDADTMAFLESCGIPTDGLGTDRLGTEQHHLQNYDIIICLDQDVARHVNQLPFHTTALTWDVDAALADAAPGDAQARRQAIYRYLTEEISDLMGLIADRRSEE
jgi:phosphate transport system protein